MTEFQEADVGALSEALLEPADTASGIGCSPGFEGPVAADVLFVGPTPAEKVVLLSALEAHGYVTRVVHTVEAALAGALAQAPDLVVVDARELGDEATGLCARFAQSAQLYGVPVIVLDRPQAPSLVVEVLSAGAADCIAQPANPAEIVARVETHLRLRQQALDAEKRSRLLESMILEEFEEIVEAQMAMMVGLAKLAESRDDETGRHLERVQRYCRLLAAKLSEKIEYAIIDHTFLDNIEYASALHDIGKVGITDRILRKPGELTAKELATMRTHTVVGARTLEAVSGNYPGNDFIDMGIKIARSHHERWDGSGYPDGLAGEGIPLCARIMAVADVYDALRSVRSYKDKLCHDESRDVIVAGAGTQFDPGVVDAFVALAPEFATIAEER